MRHGGDRSIVRDTDSVSVVDRSLAFAVASLIRDRIIDVGRTGAGRPEPILGHTYLLVIRATNDTCDGISIGAAAPSVGVDPVDKSSRQRSQRSSDLY